MRLPDTIGTPQGPSVEGASAELLRDLLDEFEFELNRAGLPLDTALRPGLAPEEVGAKFGEIGMVAPDEAIVWFGWRDGPVRHTESDLIFPIFMPWSLDEAVMMYTSPDAQPKGNEDWEWVPSWLEIMGGPTQLAIDTSAAPTDLPLVRSIDEESGTQPDRLMQQVVSLCTPVTWWIDSIRRGWYKWDPETKTWQTDSLAQGAVRAMHCLS